MILSVNLNASMDKAYVVDDFRTGTVTRVKKVISTAGGKGLNVAKVIASLKQDVIVTGFVGGFTGDFLEQVLTKQKIPYQFTHVHGETRTCINIIDKVSNIHTELLEPGPYVSKKEVEEIFRLYTRLTRRSDV
ncbi:MAG: 1-phosphofructokinase, partial [Thermoanaerobacteraceae bacterium]|nr:1-phosphofructokinase [Thermoanaerobacteraceae bacterium]